MVTPPKAAPSREAKGILKDAAASTVATSTPARDAVATAARGDRVLQPRTRCNTDAVAAAVAQTAKEMAAIGDSAWVPRSAYALMRQDKTPPGKLPTGMVAQGELSQGRKPRPPQSRERGASAAQVIPAKGARRPVVVGGTDQENGSAENISELAKSGAPMAAIAMGLADLEGMHISESEVPMTGRDDATPDPTKLDPTTLDSAKPAPATLDTAAPDPATLDTAAPDLTAPDPTAPDPTMPDLATSDPATLDPIELDPAGPGQDEAEVLRLQLQEECVRRMAAEAEARRVEERLAEQRQCHVAQMHKLQGTIR